MTDITVVLDRSGSMSSIRADTVGGFNSFLAEQQAAGADARITLAQFDHEYLVVLDAVPIDHAQPLTEATYVPRGWTALLDAIDRAITDASKRLQAGDRAILVIMTDGQENRSRRVHDTVIDGVMVTAREQVMQRINDWRSFGREVIFLGANQDAIAVGATLGVPQAQSLTYAAAGQQVQHAIHAVSRSVGSYRISGASAAMAFSRRERSLSVDPTAVVDDE